MYDIILPNAFTPNEDSTNDTYRGDGILQGAKNFSMTIWSRWGELLFETSDPEEGWNGRKFNSGKAAAQWRLCCIGEI